MDVAQDMSNGNIIINVFSFTSGISTKGL